MAFHKKHTDFIFIIIVKFRWFAVCLCSWTWIPRVSSLWIGHLFWGPCKRAQIWFFGHSWSFTCLSSESLNIKVLESVLWTDFLSFTAPHLMCLSPWAGYPLCKHSLITEMEQEVLGTEEGAILQGAFTGEPQAERSHYVEETWWGMVHLGLSVCGRTSPLCELSVFHHLAFHSRFHVVSEKKLF